MKNSFKYLLINSCYATKYTDNETMGHFVNYFTVHHKNITQIKKIQDLQRRKSKSTETLPTYNIMFRAILSATEPSNHK